jgi:hypothetical protein
MSLAHSAPHSVDSTGIPHRVIVLASLTLRRAEEEQATRRLRWRIMGADDWISWAREHHAVNRSHAAASLRRIRAAALAEGIPPRILWALARGES